MKMVFQTVIKYYNELSTRTKLAITGAAVVCGAAVFAIWNYVKRCENDIPNKDTDTVFELSDDFRSCQPGPTSPEQESTAPVESFGELSRVIVTPREWSQSEMICLVPGHLDISAISELIGSSDLGVQQNDTGSPDGIRSGPKDKNDKEIVCPELESRQQGKRDHVLQMCSVSGMGGAASDNQSSLEVCAEVKQILETNRCVDVTSSNTGKNENQITLEEIITTALAATEEHCMDSRDEIVVDATKQERRTTESEVHVDEDQIFENLLIGQLEEVLAEFKEGDAPTRNEDEAGNSFDVQEPQSFVFGPYFEQKVDVFGVNEEDDFTNKLSTTERLESEVYEYEVETRMIAVHEDLKECRKYIPVIQGQEPQSTDEANYNANGNIEDSNHYLFAREMEVFSVTCETQDKLSNPYKENEADMIAMNEATKIKGKVSRGEEESLSTENEVEKHSNTVHEDQVNIRPSLPINQCEAAVPECKTYAFTDEEEVSEHKDHYLILNDEKDESDGEENINTVHGDLPVDHCEGVLREFREVANTVGECDAEYNVCPFEEDLAVEIIVNEDIEEQVQEFYEESIVDALEQMNKEFRYEQTIVNDESLIREKTVVKNKNGNEDSPTHPAEESVPGLKADAPSVEENRDILSSLDSIEMEDLVETVEIEDRSLGLLERCMTSQFQVNEGDVLKDTELTKEMQHVPTQCRINENIEPAEENPVYGRKISTTAAGADPKDDAETANKYELDYNSHYSPVNKMEVPGEEEEVAGPNEECDTSITVAKEDDALESKEFIKEEQSENTETEVEEIVDKVYEYLSISQRESAVFQFSNDKKNAENNSLYCNIQNIESFGNEEELPEKVPSQLVDCEVDILEVDKEDVLESNMVSANEENVIPNYETEENKDSPLDCCDVVEPEPINDVVIVNESGTDRKSEPLTTKECEVSKIREDKPVAVSDSILQSNSSLPDEAKVPDNKGVIREKQQSPDLSDKCKSARFYNEEDESMANKDEITDQDSSTNVGREASFPVTEENWRANESDTTHYSHESYEHVEVTASNAMTDENITALSDNNIKQMDSFLDDVPELNPKPQEKEDTKVDIKETPCSLDTQDKPILIDAAAWRDKEFDDEIKFLVWVLSIDEGKISMVEAKVNLNRQRYHLSFEREARVELLYNICKDNAFDYNSQCKTSAGGVCYGHLKFKMSEDKINTTEESRLEIREPQYIILDEDDVIDVTDRPDLQQQFLSGVNLNEKKAEPRESDEREFGYLEDMLSDEEDDGRSKPQYQNHTPDYSFQDNGQESTRSPGDVPPTPDGHPQAPFGANQQWFPPNSATYHPPHPQGHFQRPRGGPFGYCPQTPPSQYHFDPRWAPQYPSGGPPFGMDPRGFNTQVPRYGDPWQQQGQRPRSFVQNGTTYFSQPPPFAQSAPEPQWRSGYQRPGYPRPN